MIIGNGDIATALKPVDREDFIFFASGVSNSLETRETEYRRELDMLLSQPRDKKLVYFSTLAVFYSNNRYATHKLQVEHLIKREFPDYAIMRLGNATWGKNPHHLINFIRNKIENEEDFEVRDVYRYVLTKDEFLYWVKLIPDWNCEMNIIGRRMRVVDIVEEIKGGLI